MKIGKEFFSRKADIVAKELLGKVLVVNNKRAKIVETEAYFGKEDPASRASKGENKVSKMMMEEAGRVLVYNVHKYKMLNFVTGKKGVANAVLIRAVEPLNFNSRCSGPGLLTISLGIENKFHGKMLGQEIYIENNKSDFEIIRKKRIGVTKDLDIPLRFYIKDNFCVSKK
jgi:DNA-3-methyladenine glycosylase